MPLESAERPWGSWHVLHEAEGFKVKRIDVLPGKRLSLQTHAHRSEHWVVVAGTATCIIGDQVVVAETEHSIDVPLGAVHRICNEGDELLVIVEVQHGSYLGEDDIVRLADDYGRHDC